MVSFKTIDCMVNCMIMNNSTNYGMKYENYLVHICNFKSSERGSIIRITLKYFIANIRSILHEITINFVKMFKEMINCRNSFSGFTLKRLSSINVFINYSIFFYKKQTAALYYKSLDAWSSSSVVFLQWKEMIGNFLKWLSFFTRSNSSFYIVLNWWDIQNHWDLRALLSHKTQLMFSS